MRSNIKRDLLLRQQYQNNEKKYNTLRSIYFNSYVDSSMRELAREKLEATGGLKVKIKNRCVLTGRSRGVLRKYRVSRITFKELVVAGYLVGVRKSSW